MALELTEDFIKDNGLSTEQVTAVTNHANKWHDNKVVELKGEYDGIANKDAQGILDGAITYTQKQNNFSLERKEGEKHGDYMGRYAEAFLDSRIKSLDADKAEYALKLKDFDGDAGTKEELRIAKETLDTAQQKYADYDDLKENSDKYSPLLDEFNTMKLRVAYGGVKPSFPDTVNTFEGEVKWNEFITKTEKDYTIEFDDDKPVAVSKENKHKVIPLKDLVSKDETLTELMKGRQQKGPNGKQTEMKTIDGVPFDVPKDASLSDKSKLIQDHLAQEGIKTTDLNYSKLFGEINTKINA